MFLMTHVFFSKLIFPAVDNKIILGSIFPDTNIGYDLSYENTHYSGKRLYWYLKKNYPEFLPFAKGVITHGVEPTGLDYYGDEKYLDFERGYCFERARPIIAKTLKACNLSSSFGWWKSHNFIEMGIELEILNKFPEVQKILQSAYQDAELIFNLGEILANFYYVNSSDIIKGFLHFQDYILTSNIDEVVLAKIYYQQTFWKHSVKINLPAVVDLILEAKKLISKEYLKFLDYVKEKVEQILIKIEIDQ